MAEDLKKLGESLQEVFAAKVVTLENRLDELTLVVAAADMKSVLTRLRDDAKFAFDQLVDVCGIDFVRYRVPGAYRFAPHSD